MGGKEIGVIQNCGFNFVTFCGACGNRFLGGCRGGGCGSGRSRRGAASSTNGCSWVSGRACSVFSMRLLLILIIHLVTL